MATIRVTGKGTDLPSFWISFREGWTIQLDTDKETWTALLTNIPLPAEAQLFLEKFGVKEEGWTIDTETIPQQEMWLFWAEHLYSKMGVWMDQMKQMMVGGGLKNFV